MTFSGRWIPVTERLPAIWKPVLVIKGGEVGFTWRDCYGGWQKDEELPERDKLEVTHWAELPAPPETNDMAQVMALDKECNEYWDSL